MKKPVVLGLSGGTLPNRPLTTAAAEARFAAPSYAYHDAAAALVRDGEVIAAVEEERLNRLKHTNRTAQHAIRACLAQAGVTLPEIDRLAYYAREDVMDRWARDHMLHHPHAPARWTGRAYLTQTLSEDLGCPVEASRVTFVEHHQAHAASAYLIGPFADALVVTLDAWGDGLAGTVWTGIGGRLTRVLDMKESLGSFYLDVTRRLGYEMFDEYKVMGLAACGDPARYRELFEALLTLGAGGRFRFPNIDRHRLLASLPPPRRAGAPLTAADQDFAAAAQEALERATLHLLAHYRAETGLHHLCAAGGVFHNSTMVGRIARSGLFDGVFVQPAASDAGCALGAALVAHQALRPDIPFVPLRDVYLGPDLGDPEDVRASIAAWDGLVAARCSRDVAGETAGLIAAGAVIGWVQGRSEFGPRALGNRSILADPRPVANKARINDLVKHREGYRPFAPAVLADRAEAFFEIPPGTSCDFMTATVPVKAHARALLGAVTHVDGSARVQTVSRAVNPRFAALLDAFEARTGVPVLLNTSFNHSVEPIVQSIDDAITCLLTTGLDALVAADVIVTRADRARERLATLVPVLPDHVRVVQARQASPDGGCEDVFRCEHVVAPALSRDVTRATCRVLQACDGHRPLIELLDVWPIRADHPAIVAEIADLWAHRLVRLLPVTAARCACGRSRSAAVEGPATEVVP